MDLRVWHKTYAIAALPLLVSICIFAPLWLLISDTNEYRLVIVRVLVLAGIFASAGTGFFVAKHWRKQILDRTAEVTASLQTLQSLELESRAREQAALESEADVKFTLDSVGVITQISPSAQTLWSRDPKALVGRKFIDLVPQKLRTKFADSLGDAFDSAEPFSFDTRVFLGGGTEMPVRINTRRTHHGQALVCVAHDASDLVDREKRLHEIEQRIESLVERMPAGFLVLDENYRVVRCNPEALRFFRVDMPTLMRLPVMATFSLDPSEDFARRTILRKVSHANGRTNWVELTLSKCLEGKAIRFYLIFLDVSDRERAKVARDELVSILPQFN